MEIVLMEIIQVYPVPNIGCITPIPKPSAFFAIKIQPDLQTEDHELPSFLSVAITTDCRHYFLGSFSNTVLNKVLLEKSNFCLSDTF